MRAKYRASLALPRMWKSSTFMSLPHLFGCLMGKFKQKASNLGKLGVFESKREGIFAQSHAQIHGEVMEKEKNVTDRVRDEEAPSSSSSSALYLTLLHDLFAQKHLKKVLNKTACVEEQRIVAWIIKTSPKNCAQITSKKQENNDNLLLLQRLNSVSLWMCQRSHRNWDSAFISCLTLSAASSILCPLFLLIYCRLPPPPFFNLYPPSPQIEFSSCIERIGKHWWLLHIRSSEMCRKEIIKQSKPYLFVKCKKGKDYNSSDRESSIVRQFRVKIYEIYLFQINERDPKSSKKGYRLEIWVIHKFPKPYFPACF